MNILNTPRDVIISNVLTHNLWTMEDNAKFYDKAKSTITKMFCHNKVKLREFKIKHVKEDILKGAQYYFLYKKYKYLDKTQLYKYRKELNKPINRSYKSFSKEEIEQLAIKCDFSLLDMCNNLHIDVRTLKKSIKHLGITEWFNNNSKKDIKWLK